MIRWQSTPYMLPLVIAAAVSAALALYAWRRRPTLGATPFVWLMLAVAEWSLTYALEVGSADLPAKVFWDRCEFLGIVIVPAAWLAFTLQYTGRERWLTLRNVAWVAIEPLVTLLLVWTNDSHGLIWGDIRLDTSGLFPDLGQTPQVGFWAHTAYSYLLLLVGTLLLAQALVRAPRLYRSQAGSLLIAALVPWMGNALSNFDLIPLFELDLTPFAFALTGLVITWSLFRFQLLDIVPVARDLTVESMSDGVMVLDMQNRVVDLNLAAQQVIGRTASAAIGQPAAQILSGQSHLIERFRGVTEANAEIAVGEGEGQRYFDLRISPLHDRRSRLIGRLIVFRDITERRRTEEALRKAEAETRRRLTEQTALREAGAMISSSLDLATVLNYIAEQMGLVIDATSAYICDYKPGARMSTVLAAYIGPQARAQEQMYDLGTDYYLPQDFPNLIEFLRTGQPGLVHRDAPGLAEPERSHMRQFGIQTMLIIPLQIKGQTVGYAELWESRRRREFTAHEIALCQGIAQQAAIAIENARLYDETRHHAADMSVLYTITRMASRSLMLKDALSKALSAALLLLDFEAGAIGLADPADGRLHLMVEQRLPSILSRRLRHGGLEKTLLAYAHDRRKRLILSATEPEMSPAIGQMVDEMATLGLHTCVCIPLLHQDQSLGVIGLFAHQSRSFSTSETTLLDTIGHQVATAVANARLFQTIADERSRLQALIESNRDGIILMGMNQRLLVANAPAIELLRLPGRPADWTDRPVRDILMELRRHAPAAVRTTMAEIRRIQKGDEPPAEGEYEVPPRIIHWLNLPVLAGGIPLGRLLVLRDVTQERLLEKMRDDLTRTMVHDLRNPLTTISSSLQLLGQADTLSADQRFMLGIARNSTQKMLHLINNILDVSQLESGRMPLRHEPVSLADLIAETLRTQAPLAADKSLRLESDVSPLLPPAWADVKLIERVLQNLVDNAIRFTPPSGWVRVTARSADEETTRQADGQPAEILHLCVSVSNSGPGIPPELQSRLFQKFATGDQQESGSGLGLAFCKLVVEAHGGRIWAESEPGQATTFTFTLPVAPEAA